jgi:hypothetical protein
VQYDDDLGEGVETVEADSLSEAMDLAADLVGAYLFYNAEPGVEHAVVVTVWDDDGFLRRRVILSDDLPDIQVALGRTRDRDCHAVG